MSERIAIKDLRPGMVILQITEQNGPVKIRKSGLVSSEAMVQGLAEMGVLQVEIDPEQTVEIAAKVQHRTQTQALLRGEHDTKAKFDDALSEQFNRSLFLPSVQGIPSVWRLYARQAMAASLIVALGLGLGFAAATPSLWWKPLVASVTTSPSADVKVSRDNAEPAVSKSTETAKVTKTEAEEDNTSDAGQENTEAQTAAVIAAQQPAEKPAEKPTEQSHQPVKQPDDTPVQPVAAKADTADAEPEGKILNEPKEDSDVRVSRELMARFNMAVAALDKEETDPEPAEPDTRVTVRDDIPRVDQLPARLLTRLPSMSFSAHMYASHRNDRWVRVNGRQLGEGEWIEDRVQIVNIEAQRVILSFENTLFSMAALTDW